MIGTILNVAGILVGGAVGLTVAKQLTPKTQNRIKWALGLFTIYIGLKTWLSGFTGPFLHLLAQLGIMLLSMSLGKLIGRTVGLQRGSNWLGRWAKANLTKPTSDNSGHRWSEGFVTCTLLFCVGPMAILGSIQDGLNGQWQTLAVKSGMDACAAMVFATMFGWGVLASALPVLAYQGTITLIATAWNSRMPDPELINSLNITGGILIFSVALIILELKKIEMADYLPSLLLAPLFTYWWLM